MTIHIIGKDFGKKFNELLDQTTNEIKIISPFISYKTADYLATWVEENNKDIQCTIITRFNREEFIQGANSIIALPWELNYSHSSIYIRSFIYLMRIQRY